MSSGERPDIAVILSLIGGILILLGGAAMSAFTLGMFGMTGGFEGMMGGYRGMMGSYGVPFGFMGGFSLVGLVSGIFVIVGAVMLSSRPTEHQAWGTIVLVFSVTSFLGMGGLLVGATLGIVGGAFALSWKPAAKA